MQRKGVPEERLGVGGFGIERGCLGLNVWLGRGGLKNRKMEETAGQNNHKQGVKYVAAWKRVTHT